MFKPNESSHVRSLSSIYNLPDVRCTRYCTTFQVSLTQAGIANILLIKHWNQINTQCQQNSKFRCLNIIRAVQNRDSPRYPFASDITHNIFIYLHPFALFPLNITYSVNATQSSYEPKL